MYGFSLHPLISQNVSEHIKSYCIFKIYFPDDTIAQSEIPFTCPVWNHCLYLSNIQDGRQDIRRSCNMDIFREYVTKKMMGILSRKFEDLQNIHEKLKI